MESSSRIKRQQHVVAMPYPGRGHINPMINFCKLLTTKFLVKDDIRITFVVTQEWLGFLESSSKLPPQITLRSIPNVIPSELVRGLDYGAFLEAVLTKMEDPFEQLLDQLQQEYDDPCTKVAVTTIIVDPKLPWVVSVGNRRSISVVSFWALSASVFSIYNHIDLLAQNGHYPVDFSPECGDELVDYIAGVSPIRLADMPSVLTISGQHLLGWTKESVDVVSKTKCLLLTTYHELEPQVTRSLNELLHVPVYPVGPAIPLSATLEGDRAFTENANMAEHYYYYLKWLDCQPENSVLYVSFGSFLSTSSEQMEEILGGLHESGVRYLLVSRGHTNKSGDADNDMSLVVPWCDQLRVLCHSSVGGFWTHCGWNSTLEGVYAGVPMLTFPLFTDQPTNSKLIVDDWKIGMKVGGANRLVEKALCILNSDHVVLPPSDIARLCKMFE